MNCSSGLTPDKTFSPRDFSLTEVMNCFTTLKLTSASKRAVRTDFKASSIFSSEILPLPLIFLNALENFSLKVNHPELSKTLWEYRGKSIVLQMRKPTQPDTPVREYTEQQYDNFIGIDDGR